MAYKIYQKLQSGMANQGLLDAADVDVMEDGQRITLSAKLSGLSEDVAGMSEDVAGAVAVAAGIKTAQGQEVGDVAETDIAAGVLIWHGGKLYRVLSLIAAGDHWQDMDVAETTVSEEINAMRGVSTEGVYLTITPASAIPVEGVKARIYNEASQTYLPEVTFTPASNRHLLGQIAYGEVYTIIMPSIDGYTQPADQTFKAGQMMRDRTVEYVESAMAQFEEILIKAKTSNNAAIGDVNVTVTVYGGEGNVAQTITKSIEGGQAETFSLPLGTKYKVEFPDISGFLTPKPLTFTAALRNRVFSSTYVYIPGSQYKFVTTDFNYYDMDADMTSIIEDGKLLGVAFMTSTLLANDGAFIYVLYNKSINGVTVPKSRDLQTANYWSNPAVDVLQAISTYNGQLNTVNAYQTILQYEQDNNVTVASIFKDLYNNPNTSIVVNGVTYDYFIPTRSQMSVAVNAANQIAEVLAYYGVTDTIQGNTLGETYSRQISATVAEHQGGNNTCPKTSLGYASRPRYVLPII